MSRKLLSTLSVLLFTACLANADTVVPGALTGVEGNSNNSFPFNLAIGGITSMRYQQVYAGSEFSGPILISGLVFRPDSVFGSAFSATLTNVQIDLSTTSAAPDGLSTTFANNVGADVTTVFSGALNLSSSNTGPASGPKDFDIVIALTTPFLYNSTLGNLLLDVRNFNGGATTIFDAQFGADSISRVINDVNATSGEADTLGLVTKFISSSSTPIPEPTSLLLLGTGLGVIGFAARRRKK